MIASWASKLDWFDKRRIVIIITVLALVHVSLAFIGGVLNYSPIPFWDMWEAMSFYDQTKTHGWEIWWEQHNEHRIVLARMFFWLDFEFFNGSSIFLVICNYVLAGMAFLIFYCMLRDTLTDENDTLTRYVIALIILCMMFSWDQQENLNWTFQSQFFLAQSLPLLSFYLLYKSHAAKDSIYLFVAACCVGVLSLGTMANGVLALPLMVILAILLRMRYEYVLMLIALAVCGLGLYFHDFSYVKGHGSLKEAILETPIQYIEYILVYLGNPFQSIFRLSIIAGLAGLFMIVSASMFLIRSLKAPTASAMQFTLLTYIAFIGATAVGTGGGRLIFGLVQALSSRYATPTLMAWAALLLLYAPLIAKKARTNPRALLPLLLIPVITLPYQLSALSPKKTVLYEKMIAAVALELSVKDDKQVGYVYPETAHVLKQSVEARQSHRSFFENPLIKDASSLIGTKENDVSSAVCTGTLDSIVAIKNEERFMRAQGTLFNPAQGKSPKIVHILDTDRTIIGYGLTGAKDEQGKRTGFKAYVLAGKQGNVMILRGVDPDCEITVEVKND